MVKKLYKYEFKSYGMWVLLMYGAMIASAIMLSVALHLTEEISIFSDDYSLKDMFNDSVRSIFFIIYGISIVASFTLIVILPIVRFYKNLLTPEGYLTLSLPVKPSDHIICKTTVACLYQLGAVIAFAFSVFVLILLSGSYSDFAELMKAIIPNIWKGFAELDPIIKIEIILFCIAILLYPIANMLMYYFCLASGMLFGKYKLIGSVLVYIVLRTVASVVTGVGQIVLMQATLMIDDPVVLTAIIAVIVLLAVVAMILIFYYLTRYLFTHKVNL